MEPLDQEKAFHPLWCRVHVGVRADGCRGSGTWICATVIHGELRAAARALRRVEIRGTPRHAGAVPTVYLTVSCANRRHCVSGKLDLFGYIAALLTTSAFVPQAIKTIRSRDTRAISLWMYVVFTTGVAFWLAYGVALASLPIVLA